jgi:hypothetical protein
MDDRRSDTVEWLREVWHSRPGVLLKKRGILVLDALNGHSTEQVKTVACDLLKMNLVKFFKLMIFFLEISLYGVLCVNCNVNMNILSFLLTEILNKMI